MINTQRTLFVMFFLLSSALVLLSTAQFNNAFAKASLTTARAWKSPDKIRIVFELSDKVSYNAFSLDKPHRLVIDIKNISIKQSIFNSLTKHDLIKTIRTSTKGKDYRLVLQLSKRISYKHFILPPGHGYKYRLVFDLFDKKTKLKSSSTKSSSSSSKSNLTKSNPVKKTTPIKKNIKKKAVIKQKSIKTQQITKSVTRLKKRDLIVAIDAGHGGDDPGASGRNGTKEKVVVLQIAKKLAKKINRQKGMRAVMIRTGDYYISLRGRTQKARKANADVFVSIHADAFRNSKAKGSSVFILSRRGATSETARWLAAKENSADLAGGVSLDDKDDILAKVLLDLSQTASIEGSNSVAKRILKGLKRIGKTHKKQVERAGFVVLKSPDIPSVLVETGFISNPYEEKKLRTASYQRKLADAIFDGINNYFRRYPIPGTIYGQDITAKTPFRTTKTTVKTLSKSKKTKYHTVRRGDSLSKLAQRYRVSIRELKRYNRLKSNTLVLGKKIKIP